MKQILSSIKDLMDLHSLIQSLHPSAMLLSTPSAQALCKTPWYKYSMIVVMSVNQWKAQWQERGLQGPYCCTVGLGKDSVGEEPPRSVLRDQIWFLSKVNGSPLGKFMQVSEIIKFNAVKSFARIFQNLIQSIFFKWGCQIFTTQIILKFHSFFLKFFHCHEILITLYLIAQ